MFVLIVNIRIKNKNKNVNINNNHYHYNQARRNFIKSLTIGAIFFLFDEESVKASRWGMA